MRDWLWEPKLYCSATQNNTTFKTKYAVKKSRTQSHYIRMSILSFMLLLSNNNGLMHVSPSIYSFGHNFRIFHDFLFAGNWVDDSYFGNFRVASPADWLGNQCALLCLVTESRMLQANCLRFHFCIGHRSRSSQYRQTSWLFFVLRTENKKLHLLVTDIAYPLSPCSRLPQSSVNFRRAVCFILSKLYSPAWVCAFVFSRWNHCDGKLIQRWTTQRHQTNTRGTRVSEV